jgi:hypothetical protein
MTNRSSPFGSCRRVALAIATLLMAMAAIVAFFIAQAMGLWGGSAPGQGPGAGGNPGGGGASAVTYRGSDSTGQVPGLPAAEFTAGDAPTDVSGAFSISDGLALDAPASNADGTEFTLIYGEYASSGDSIAVGFSRQDGSEGLGLSIFSGDWLATYLGEGCSWEVNVSSSSIDGHISCSNLPASNQADGSSGTISTEFDFNADFTPVSDD